MIGIRWKKPRYMHLGGGALRRHDWTGVVIGRFFIGFVSHPPVADTRMEIVEVQDRIRDLLSAK